MATKNREEIKALFENGMKPNEEDFAAIIDGTINFSDDDITVKSGKVGIKTLDPKATLHVYDDGIGDFTTKTNKSGTLMVGDADALNLSFDNNEIMARKGADISPLLLQTNGGDVNMFIFKSPGNRVVVKDTGRIGVGTDEPGAPLHIKGTTDVEEGTKDAMLIIGDKDGKNLSFDDNEIMAKKTDGEQAGTLYVQANGGDVYFHSKESVGKQVIIKDNGRVGIGTGDPQAQLHIYSTVDKVKDDSIGAVFMIGPSTSYNLSFDRDEIMAKYGATPTTLYLNRDGGNLYHNGSNIHTSDRNLKKDIKPLNKGLSSLKKLEPVSFKWRKESGNSGDLKYGFIAQDVEKVLKDVIYTNEKDDTLGMSSIELIPVLTKAIQEQQEQIEKMEARLAKLEKLIQKK